MGKGNHDIHTYVYNSNLPKEKKNKVMSFARKGGGNKANKPNGDKYQNLKFLSLNYKM